MALFALKLERSGQKMWVCGFYGFVFRKFPLEIGQQEQETLKKDPLLPLFFNERSGNDLMRYNAKLNMDVSYLAGLTELVELAERRPDAAESSE
ncbi:hypothetical protein NE619_06795 [Anaerovorax odorimutans]|uniref:Uncharacterized protein n=1 Tax=Anaerovorax odorimutans TaxID=109327 RepID=A0ABT1RNE4_9FIRM|nr:hypothetical protein [Anaerovorax odorimutans]MCQ4636431.1 hypothetical protein [Anaerovorax odorimutans]